jgi:hypothetical protein
VPERRPCPPVVRIREVRSPQDREVGRAHRLLKLVFPTAELLPVREWREALRERAAGLWTDMDWHLMVAEAGGRLLGAASGTYLGNLKVGLVGYVAVLRKARGCGLGGRLRRALQTAIARDARRIHRQPLRAMVGEVHADNPWLAHLVREEAALALDFPYVQPSLHHTEAPVRLVLYYQPLGARPRTLPADDVRRLVYALWRRVYRVGRPMRRAPFRRMLRALARGTRIGTRPLKQLGPGARGHGVRRHQHGMIPAARAVSGRGAGIQ